MLDQMSKALSSLQQRARIKVLPLLFFTGTGPDLGQLYRKELVTPESEVSLKDFQDVISLYHSYLV